MPCYSPLHGYKSKNLTETGKRKITFSRQSGLIDLVMTVPCGQCIGCRIDRSRQWALRCVHEAKLHKENCFVTLTYDDEHLPPADTLLKTDLQYFFRKLRKSGVNFRYYACGEYGDISQRPHYHAIIFGHQFLKDRKRHSTAKNGDVVYISESLNKLWGNGYCTIGSFNYSSAAYVARYCMKKQMGKDAINHTNYTRVDVDSGVLYQVAPEFALMSLKPGIGSGWYDKYKSDAFPSDFLTHQGKKHPVPRYYTEKLKKEDETTHSKIKGKRKKQAKLLADNNTPDRLAVRETCKKAQTSSLKRNI
ncbi:MAG: replication initiator protein [Microviridae sp.]|nr:MAG: replication initiator protein [Microviridae sp.]